MMKTTNQTNQRFPGAFRMILYIAVVAALGLVSCIVKAGVPEKDSGLVNRLEAAAIVQAEPELRLEDWMLDSAHFVIEPLLTAIYNR